jgi:hypothetical protein
VKDAKPGGMRAEGSEIARAREGGSGPAGAVPACSHGAFEAEGEVVNPARYRSGTASAAGAPWWLSQRALAEAKERTIGRRQGADAGSPADQHPVVGASRTSAFGREEGGASRMALLVG